VIDSEFISEPQRNTLFQSTLAAIPGQRCGKKIASGSYQIRARNLAENSGTPPLNWARTGIGLQKYIRVQPILSKNLEQNLEPDMELLPNALSKKRGAARAKCPINARD